MIAVPTKKVTSWIRPKQALHFWLQVLEKIKRSQQTTRSQSSDVSQMYTLSSRKHKQQRRSVLKFNVFDFFSEILIRLSSLLGNDGRASIKKSLNVGGSDGIKKLGTCPVECAWRLQSFIERKFNFPLEKTVMSARPSKQYNWRKKILIPGDQLKFSTFYVLFLRQSYALFFYWPSF